MVELFMGMVQVGAEWVLYLLLVTSVACVGIFVERWLYFRRNRGDLADLKSGLVQALDKQEGVDRLADAYLKRPGVPARLCGVALENRHRSPEAAQEVIESRALEERRLLERGVSFLGTVGANAPFVGLFGTVLGIIKAFRDLSLAKTAGPQVVMAGISEALVATAVGLLVAIPAVVAYNHFRGRAKRILSDADVLVKIALSYQLDRFLGAGGGSSGQVGGSEKGSEGETAQPPLALALNLRGPEGRERGRAPKATA